MLGRYKEGWRYYEARFNCPDFDDVSPPTSGPPLQSLSEAPRNNEESLIVWSEQGMGDVIQFCRYLHLLEQPRFRLFSLPGPVLSLSSEIGRAMANEFSLLQALTVWLIRGNTSLS